MTCQMAKTLLIVGYVWPEPRSSAAGTRILQLIRWAQSIGYSVSFACAAEKGANFDELTALGINSLSIVLNCSSFDQAVGALAPDVVIFDRFVTEEQFGWRVMQACPSALRVLDSEDLHCLRDARTRAFKAKAEVVELSSEFLFSDMARREIAAIYRSDLTLVISDAEMLLLQQRFGVPAALLHHCPFMFEPAEQSHWLSYGEKQHFVFIGNYQHAPNWDAVLFLRELWPAIANQLPGVELHIYGAYPPKKAMQLDNPHLRFRVLGWAKDALAVMSSARVCIAPLRFGAGIKGKLAEAMLCGTPSVTTDIGAEGMTQLNQLAWPGIIANSAADFVSAAVKLYADTKVWQQAQKQGLINFMTLFDRAAVEADLTKRVQHIAGNLDQHRLENFMGSLLLQQQYRSTEFMSRWIEVKSKLPSSIEATEPDSRRSQN